MPGRHEDERYCGGFLRFQPFWLGNDVDFRYTDEFRIAAVYKISYDLVGSAHAVAPGKAILAHAATQARRDDYLVSRAGPRYKSAGLHNFPRDVVSRNVRKRDLNAWEAYASPDVKVIESTSFDPHQNFVILHRRVWSLFIS
jgi:hypothetical protein